MNKALIHRALKYVKALKARDAAYAQEVADWYRAGEGRSPKWITELSPDGEPYQINVGGKGYRFPYCPHGMSLWTDYDNICGGCEDPISVYAEALMYAHRDFATMQKRLDWLMGDFFGEIPDDARKSLMDWAMETMLSEV